MLIREIAWVLRKWLVYLLGGNATYVLFSQSQQMLTNVSINLGISFLTRKFPRRRGNTLINEKMAWLIGFL